MRNAAIFLLAALVSATAARGGSFEVAPTTLDLSAGKAGLLYIENDGAARVTIQIQPMDWKQSGGGDVLTPSETLMASPPLVRISPGTRQVVRVLADVAAVRRERQYRLLLNELPEQTSQPGIHVLLQLKIPVFVSGASTRPKIVWSARASANEMEIYARNDGASAVKFSQATVSSPGSRPDDFVKNLVYLLPGAQARWLVPSENAPSLHIAVRDERSGTVLDADVPVQR